MQMLKPALALTVILLLGACATDGPGPLSPSSDDSAQAAAVGQSDQDLRVVRDLPPPDNTDNGLNQPIAPNDILTVTVFGVPDLSHDVQVDSTGRANLALVGSVPAAGQTVQEFQASLTRLYGAKYLQNPNITVTTKSANGQQVTVDGEFNHAGVFPAANSTSLIQVIAEANGLSSIADEDKIFVYRNFGDHREVAQYSAAAIRAGKRPDPRIYGGDVVIAFASGTAIAAQNLRQALGLATSALPLRGL